MNTQQPFNTESTPSAKICENLWLKKALACSRSAFTLFEMLIALVLFVLISGGIYRVASASIETTKVTMSNQVYEEQLETFLAATRRAFFNLPARGSIALRYDTTGGTGTPEMVFRGASSPFGIPVFDKGELILSARPQSDGTRLFALLRIPPDTSTTDASVLRSRASWFPLLRRVDKVEWAVLQDDEWVAEWDSNARPTLVRLRFSMRDTGDVIESLFRVPPATTPPRADGARARRQQQQQQEEEK